MNVVFTPEFVPLIGSVVAGVSEDCGALLHALLELDREAEQRGIGEVERCESTMSKGDVDCAFGLAGVQRWPVVTSPMRR